MSRPSSPILVSSRDSTPTPPTAPDEVQRQIQIFRGRRIALMATVTVRTPSPPSSLPNERTSDGLDQAVRGRMTTTTITPTLTQIQQNILEDTRMYQEEWIEELTDAQGAMYSRTFAHAAMISHWATMFHEPISNMIVNFAATPSIAIPVLRSGLTFSFPFLLSHVPNRLPILSHHPVTYFPFSPSCDPFHDSFLLSMTHS